jgi:type II secretory pathway pseudopilin PulG
MKAKVLFLIIGLLAAIFLLPLILPSPYRTYLHIKMDEEMLLQALNSYRSVYNRYPAGNSFEVLSTLTGNNPQKTVFLNIDASSTNNIGEFVDPWQTPFQLTFESTNHVTIRSAGKNKIFGDKDDVELSDPPKQP